MNIRFRESYYLLKLDYLQRFCSYTNILFKLVEYLNQFGIQ